MNEQIVLNCENYQLYDCQLREMDTTNLLSIYENLIISLNILTDKYNANKKTSSGFKIHCTSSVIENPPHIYEFTSSSDKTEVCREINTLTRAIYRLNVDNDKLRVLFLLVYYGENDTIHALPQNILMYSKVKYPKLLYYYMYKKKKARLVHNCPCVKKKYEKSEI